MSFRVQLDLFRGPLDLLLYLVRKHEVAVTEIPIATITEQFLDYVAVLEQLDVDAVGDFLDMASTLIEIKSQLVLPHEEIEEEQLEDPRQGLVQRLLEFKRYRDAAAMLEEQARQWRDSYPRIVNDLPSPSNSLLDQPIQGVELWDLVSAFGRVMRERLEVAKPTTIRYDETPIQTHMERIYDRLQSEHSLEFVSLFPEVVHKSTLVGMFLAILELVRYRHALVRQPDPFGPIWIEPGPEPYAPATVAISSATH